jgi:hypothetical protein
MGTPGLVDNNCCRIRCACLDAGCVKYHLLSLPICSAHSLYHHRLRNSRTRLAISYLFSCMTLAKLHTFILCRYDCVLQILCLRLQVPKQLGLKVEIVKGIPLKDDENFCRFRSCIHDCGLLKVALKFQFFFLKCSF